MALFFLAGGVEYSVVFPTMLDYLKDKGGEEWLYGLTLAGFSISNLVTAPLYGVVFDKTHKTKIIVLFANLFEIGGENVVMDFFYFSINNQKSERNFRVTVLIKFCLISDVLISRFYPTYLDIAKLEWSR